MDSAERFDGNKWYVKERLQKEENPAVRELLQADHDFHDEILYIPLRLPTLHGTFAHTRRFCPRRCPYLIDNTIALFIVLPYP